MGEEVVKQHQTELLKEISQAQEAQLTAQNKAESQLVAANQKLERLSKEFEDIDTQHAYEAEQLTKSLRAQNWKLAQLHMSEQQSIEEFENLGLFVQASQFHGGPDGSNEQGKEVDVLDAQIAVLKDQMTQSAESRLVLRTKLDHLLQTKYEVEAAWELATKEQDQTVERLTDALEKEKRVSDKLEQACKAPGPPRHSRFDVPDIVETPETYAEEEPRQYVTSRLPVQYSPYNQTERAYEAAETRRHVAQRQEAAKESGLQSLNSLYKGHGVVQVSHLEKLDSTTLGAALRLLH